MSLVFYLSDNYFIIPPHLGSLLLQNYQTCLLHSRVILYSSSELLPEFPSSDKQNVSRSALLMTSKDFFMSPRTNNTLARQRSSIPLQHSNLPGSILFTSFSLSLLGFHTNGTAFQYPLPPSCLLVSLPQSRCGTDIAALLRNSTPPSHQVSGTRRQCVEISSRRVSVFETHQETVKIQK